MRSNTWDGVVMNTLVILVIFVIFIIISLIAFSGVWLVDGGREEKQVRIATLLQLRHEDGLQRLHEAQEGEDFPCHHRAQKSTDLLLSPREVVSLIVLGAEHEGV